jgi:hypothetical protein
MGLIQDNDALTDAAIQEMLKLPIGQEGTARHLVMNWDNAMLTV